MDERTGNPRTLADHDDWRLRAVQKQSGEDTNLVAAKTGLRIATVVRIDPYGHVMIDAFFDAVTGQGSWFKVLNFTQPFPGESVVWAYVNGSPAVLGPYTSPDRPWRVPLRGMPDTFYFDEFDVGSVDDAQGVGLSRWTYELSDLSTTTLTAGSNGHPGLWTLNAGSGNTEYARGFTPAFTLNTELISEIEFIVQLSSPTSVAYHVGFQGDTGGTNAFYALYDTNIDANGWTMRRVAGGVATDLGLTDPVVPVIANHWYSLNFMHTVNPGEWRLEVVDLSSDPPVRGIIVLDGFPNLDARVLLQAYNRATGIKSMVVDCMWWSRRQLNRV